jgi:DNA-binding transcriptional LysR family regulator
VDQLRAVRTFLEVVDRGGFAGAARAMAQSPAVVTRLVADLEQHLGTRLLNRTTRSVALTQAGQAYAAQTRPLLAALEQADAQARAATALPQGRLRVQVPPSFAVHQLAKALPAFRSRCPGVTLEIVASGPVASVDERCDLSIIVTQGEELDGDFVARPLARSELVLCASPEYIERFSRPGHPRDLASHDVLVPPIPDVRRGVAFRRGEAGDAEAVVVFRPREPAVSSLHLDAVYAAALAGMGIVGLPSFMADEALRLGTLQRVLDEWHVATLSLWVGLPSRQHLPVATRAFRNFLVDTYGAAPRADPWLCALGQRAPGIDLAAPQPADRRPVLPS